QRRRPCALHREDQQGQRAPPRRRRDPGLDGTRRGAVVEVTYEAVSTPVIQPTLRAAGGLAWLIPLSGWTPAWLFDRGTSRWRYIAKLGVTSQVPAFVRGFVIAIALTAWGAPTDGL